MNKECDRELRKENYIMDDIMIILFYVIFFPRVNFISNSIKK